MIALDIIENAVGIEHLNNNECSELDIDLQELIILSVQNNKQPHANKIVNI